MMELQKHLKDLGLTLLKLVGITGGRFTKACYASRQSELPSRNDRLYELIKRDAGKGRRPGGLSDYLIELDEQEFYHDGL